jgi:protocatechuate 3,4-dioxygenase beta subunit
MGKAPARTQWIVVALLLGGALIMTLGLLFPSLLGDTQGSRKADMAGGLAGPASRNETLSAPGEEEEAAAAAAAAKRELVGELPPYGDRDLPHDQAIRGRITDKEDKPVADAIVVAVYRDWRARPYQIVTASRVRSEEDGFFVLGPLERRSYYVLAIKKEVGVGYATNQMPGAWVELVLVPGARLTGTVTTREGREPVAGATVIVKDWTFYADTTTDAEGKYVLAPLPATADTWSGQQVMVVADEFQTAERNNLLLKGGVEHKVDFLLEKGATLNGKVIHGQTLQPVAGATVGEGWEPYHRTTTTKEDGSYALPNVNTDPNLVFTVRAEGFLPQEQQSDGTGTLDFQLDASLVVEGKVLDPLDNAVAGARVYLHRIKYAPGFSWTKSRNAKKFTTTDAEGVFRFPDVLPGDVAVVAFHKEFAPGEKGPIQIPMGGPVPDGNDITLKRGFTVRGEVRDLQDNPLPSIRVQMYRSGWQIKGYKWVQYYRWSENPIWYTDEKGRFELRGAMAGKHWLSAWHNDFGWAGTQVEGVDDQRITDVIISFAGATITGMFTTADGDPVPGAWVYATGPKNTPQRMSRWTQTDALGAFKLAGLKEGSYDINGSSSFGRPEKLLDIPAGTNDVELKLQITQILRGEVTSVLTGRALERFYLSIQPDRKTSSRRIPGYRRPRGWSGWLRTPDGRFERPVMPGKYNLTFKAPGHAPKVMREVIVEENIPPQGVFMSLDRGGGIQGVIKDQEGKPLSNQYLYARVYRAPGEQAQPTDGMLGGYDYSDTKGRYFIEGLADGTYLIDLNLRSRGAATAVVSVVGSGMVRQNLQLLPTGTIVLKVVDEEGKPISGVRFYFRDENNRYLGYARQTNNAGITTSGPLRMGHAMVQAYGSKYAVDPFPVTIESGKTVTVDVTMQKKEKKQ